MEAKQVIVIRKDLNMRKGKMVAQGCHASLGALLKHKWKLLLVLLFPFFSFHNNPLYRWINGPFVKICVSVNSEAELFEVFEKVIDWNKGRSSGIPFALIKDAGRTEFNGVPTYTSLGIGPWWSDELDKITGHLKLL